MLYREIIAACYDVRTEHGNAQCCQIAEVLVRSQNCDCWLGRVSVRPPVTQSNTGRFGYHWMDCHEIWYLSTFRKSVEKIQVLLKSDKSNVYFTWRPMRVYDNISVLLRMRRFSGTSCRESRYTHFMFDSFCFVFSKMVPFVRQCGKNMVEPDRPQITMLYGACAWRAG
jgi:hypothetical protein